MLKSVVVPIFILTFDLLVFLPNHCKALICYNCYEWTKDFLAGTQYKNPYIDCIEGSDPFHNLKDIPNINETTHPTGVYCRKDCFRREMYDPKNGKLIGVQKGCIDSILDENIKECVLEKVKDKPNCYHWLDSELTEAIKKCISSEQRSSGGADITDDAKKRQLLEPDPGNKITKICLCHESYCNEKNKGYSEGASAGNSFRRTLATTTGGTGLMIILLTTILAVVLL